MMTDLILTLAQAGAPGAPQAAARAEKGGGLLHQWSFGHVGNSTQAYETEWLYIFIVWVNIISFLVVVGPMIWFAFKYHRSKQATNYQVSAAHNTPLELSWSIIPLLVMVPIFFWGFEGYIRKLAAPSDSEEIQIKGTTWQWTATYRNGAEPPPKEWVHITQSGEQAVPLIVVPANRPVKLLMHSADVIHAFFIPDFRTKMDVFPNRYTSMWFEARDTTQRAADGTWMRDTGGTHKEFVGHKVFCAEYCGDKHSEMAAGIVVLTPEEYAQTLVQWAIPYDDKTPPIEIGKIVAVKRACATCHSVDGAKNTGPTWKNWFGYENTYTDGSKHVADENWLMDSILYSQKHIVQDFPNSMPLYAGVLKPIEINGVIEYIKSLSDKGPYSGDGVTVDPAAPPATAPSTAPATPPPAH